MKRSPSNDRPAAAPVEHIPLPEGKVKLRAALLIALLVIAAVSFGIGINALVGTEAGLQEISALSGEMNCSEDFTFYYNLGYDGADATDERRAIRTLYSEAAGDALEIFSADSEFEGRNNVFTLNSRPNEAVSVDAALYEALSLVEAAGARYIYLAPLYEQAYSLVNSASDAEAAEFDPRAGGAAADFAAGIARFASDPGAVRIELLGDNTVRLAVSEEYLEYAAENAVERFIDFGWLKNAFICDYLAGTLAAAGYTRGALFSADGFSRSLDGETGVQYSLEIPHREGGSVSAIGALELGGTFSAVLLRDYPMNEGEDYYIYENGDIRSMFIDPADGLDRTAAPEIAFCSFDSGCAALALEAAPLYISESLDPDALETLAGEGVTVYYTDNGALREIGAH